MRVSIIFLKNGEVALLIQTHKQFAAYFLAELQRNLNIQLNKHSFIFGNIEPDLPFVLPTVKHYKQNNYAFILSLIDDLYEYNYNGKAFSLARLSEKLGIVNHYLCDYFCRPHFDRKYYSNRLMEHIDYEKKLHQYLLRDFSFKNNLPKTSPTIFSLEGISSFIEEQLYHYENQEAGFQTDIEFALNSVSAINSTILTNVVCTDCELSINTL